MAKKKGKKRKPTRPSTAPSSAAAAKERGDADASPSRRAERREEAKRERERRIREARRRQRMRRLARWAIVGGIILAIVAIFLFVRSRGQQEEAQAQEAAQRIGCEEVVTKQDELDAFAALGEQQHAQPYAQGTGGVPVTAGAHAQALPPEPKVFSQPIQEPAAVHNLEHGYVLVYYAGEGENALPEGVRTALEDVVQGESEVLMAQYEGLSSSLALVSWGRLQTCQMPEDAGPGDAETVVRSFIEENRNSSLAPEPGA